MDDNLQKTMEKIIDLSEKIDERTEKGEKLEFGDHLVIEYNRLASCLPALFSLGEVLDIYAQLAFDNEKLESLETDNRRLEEELREYKGIDSEIIELREKLDDLSGYPVKLKERILHELRKQVSDDAYSLVEEVVEGVYSSWQSRKD